MVAQLLQNDFTVIASSYKSKYNNARYQGIFALLWIFFTIVSHCMPSRSESIRDISNKVSSANVQNGETLAALHRHKILRLLLKSVENYCIDELQSSNRPEHSILDATLKVIDKLTNVYEKMSKEISSEDQDKDRDGQHRLDHSLAAVIDAVLREDDEAMMENIRAMEDEEVEEALYVEEEEEEEDAMLADEEAMMENIRAMEDEEVEEAVYEDMTTSDDDNNAEDEETGFEVGSESDDDLIIDGHDSDDDDGDEDDDSENHFDDFSDDELDPEDEREMERLVERGMIDEFARDDRQDIGNRIRQRSNQIVPVDSDGGYSDRRRGR